MCYQQLISLVLLWLEEMLHKTLRRCHGRSGRITTVAEGGER